MSYLLDNDIVLLLFVTNVQCGIYVYMDCITVHHVASYQVNLHKAIYLLQKKYLHV